MRAPLPIADIATMALQFEAAPGIARLREICPDFASATAETVHAVLDEAARFAETHLGPLNDRADADGCRLIEQRVHTAPGHRAVWDAFVTGGWTTLDHPASIGGQGLPLALAMSVQELFDRSCAAFGMLPVPQRSATKLIAAHGDSAMRSEWLPHLVSGDWGATICISEADAGSDVGRIRTRAEPFGDGTWSVTGEKCWISFGDHDLTTRIGHCLLARTPGAAPGGAGLSLFLVPDTRPDPAGRGDVANNVHVRRLEHKMGLHGSPTCTLGFEGAIGRMIGAEGRGLAQMFVMITNMRMSVSAMGLGIAAGSTDIALAYARDRRQGGPVGAPETIIAHPDVQRGLLGAIARVEMLRGLILAAANQADLAAQEPDAEARADAAALTQWLLPIVKTTGGDYAFDCANAAIQTLGGAGYTQDWPVEQYARDARVLTIFEGTTGIQALDLLHRRLLREDRRGFDVFLRTARAAGAACRAPEGPRLMRCLDMLEDAATDLLALSRSIRAAESGATAFLHLAALAATGWTAARLASSITPNDPSRRRLVAAARYWLSDIDARAGCLRSAIATGQDALVLGADVFGDV